MNKTAIELAVDNHKEKIAAIDAGLRTNNISYNDEVAILACRTVLEDTVIVLQSLLPTEQQQIEQYATAQNKALADEVERLKQEIEELQGKPFDNIVKAFKEVYGEDL